MDESCQNVRKTTEIDGTLRLDSFCDDRKLPRHLGPEVTYTKYIDECRAAGCRIIATQTNHSAMRVSSPFIFFSTPTVENV